MGHTVADQLVGGLIAAGVACIYGPVDDSLNPVVEVSPHDSVHNIELKST
jgi:hypothetical protein